MKRELAKKVKTSLLHHLSGKKESKKNISIILAPFSAGGPNDAAKEGPKALISNGIAEDLFELGFDVKIIHPNKELIRHASVVKKTNEKNRIKNIDSIVKINEWISKTVATELEKDSIPLTIGGDHSLAIGTISGVSSVYKNTGVLWIDRHFDAHSPKNTPSWRAHGMPVAVVTANKNYDRHLDFQKLVRIGHRDIDSPSIKLENFVQIAIGEKSHIFPQTKWYSMEDVDNFGIKKIIEDSIDYLLKRVKHIYVAWDIDSMNVTGTGTSGDGQLNLREGLIIARAINNKIRLVGKLAGFEMVEIAPKLERKDLKGQTVDWALQLITTSFGGNLFNNLSRLKRNIRV